MRARLRIFSTIIRGFHMLGVTEKCGDGTLYILYAQKGLKGRRTRLYEMTHMQLLNREYVIKTHCMHTLSATAAVNQGKENSRDTFRAQRLPTTHPKTRGWRSIPVQS